MTLLLGTAVAVRDSARSRFQFFQRLYYSLATLALFAAFWGIVVWNNYFEESPPPSWSQSDQILVVAISFYWGLTLVDVCVTRETNRRIQEKISVNKGIVDHVETIFLARCNSA